MSNGYASLLFGDLELVDPLGSPYAIETVADGTSFGGGPNAVNQAVASLLLDGAVTLYDHSENIELSMVVLITGDDLGACADGAAALTKQLHRANTLTWTPPDGVGLPCVFEVWTSSMVNVDDDLAMVRNPPSLTFRINLTCQPWVRSVEQIMSPALPTPAPSTTPVTTQVANGSESTGWSRSQPNPASWGLSGVYSVEYVADGGATLGLAYDGSTNVTNTRYLVIDYVYRAVKNGISIDSTADALRVGFNNISGSTSSPLTVSPSPITYPTGFTGLRAWFSIPSSVTTLTRVFASLAQTGNATGVTWQYGVDNISATNVAPSIGTARQQTRFITVPGAVRTQASLLISSATTALGDTLVYTCTTDSPGYQPSLRRWIAPGASTSTDASTVSGQYQSTAGSPFVASIPVLSLPRGMTHLYARVRRQGGAGSSQVLWSVDTRRNGVQLAPEATGSFTRNFTGGWEIIPLGRMVARAIATKAHSDAVVQVAILSTALDLDEAWLFNIDREVGVSGAVSLVSCGSYKVLSLEAPQTTDPYPRIFVGDDAANQATWVHASNNVITAFGQHEAPVPAINLFTVCNATDSQASQWAYSRWHTFVGSN